MLPQPFGRLAGVITLEDLTPERSAGDSPADREDATLSQIMARLAQKCGVSRECFEPTPGRWPNSLAASRITADLFDLRTASPIGPSEWVVADLDRLTAELLELAAHARAEIACARKAG